MIGIFDSGIGGVTVLSEIYKLLPNLDYIYYSDSVHNPYGDYSKEDLIKIIDNVINILISKNCKIIVIACNTASTHVEYFRNRYSDVIFIAIEPAYKMVYDYAYDKKTLVMATKGTIESEKFKSLYHKYDNNNTTLYECVGLAELIENNDTKGIDNYLIKHLSKFKGVDNVVLGCTHYPLIKNNIGKVLGNVMFFDGSDGVSKEVYKKSSGLKGSGSITFIDSSDSNKEERFYDILKSLG